MSGRPCFVTVPNTKDALVLDGTTLRSSSSMYFVAGPGVGGGVATQEHTVRFLGGSQSTGSHGSQRTLATPLQENIPRQPLSTHIELFSL